LSVLVELGLIAVLITIMVLEMKVPIGERLEALVPVVPVFRKMRQRCYRARNGRRALGR
jgi:hypothetical protein